MRAASLTYTFIPQTYFEKGEGGIGVGSTKLCKAHPSFSRQKEASQGSFFAGGGVGSTMHYKAPLSPEASLP